MRLGMNKGDVLCIDWDERSLRILETSMHRSGPTVRRAVNAPIPEGLDVRDPSAMGDFLRRTLGEHRIRTRRAIADIPRQDTVLNRLALPTGTMDELAAMVHLQIAKELPFSKDQAVIDFAVVPKSGATTCDVWVAAIRVNILEYYRQVFAASGIRLERMGLRPYANLLAVQAQGLNQGRVVMVDVGPSMTEINILRDGALMYTRAASVSVPVSVRPAPGGAGDGEQAGGASAASAAEPWSMDNLLIEVSRTIAAYRATDIGATIDRIVLSGTAGIDERLVQAFEDRFSVSTEIFSLPPNFRWRADMDGSAAPFSAAVGLALGHLADVGQRFDFLHVKEPEAEHRQRVRQRPVLVALAAAAALGLGWVGYQPIRIKAAEVSGLEDAIKLENKDVKQRGEALKKIADLQSWQDANVPWIDYLQELADVFPSNQECYITQLEVNTEKGLITLKLAARDRYAAIKVIDAVSSVVNKKGEPIFKAVPGSKADVSKDPAYPVSDVVVITVLPVAPKPKPARR